MAGVSSACESELGVPKRKGASQHWSMLHGQVMVTEGMQSATSRFCAVGGLEVSPRGCWAVTNIRGLACRTKKDLGFHGK